MVLSDRKHKLGSVSAVIPAYNGRRYVGRAIESVLKQTCPAAEVIVVDDGSTDGTAAAVRAFGDAVRLIEQPNGGVSVARNTGIAAATGDWIAFLDADDEWLPDKLRRQSQFFERYPHLKWGYANFSDTSKAGQRSVHPSLPSERQPTYGFDDYFDGYCRGVYAWTGTVMVHRSVFETVGGFEPGMKRAQDNDLWFRIAYQFPQVGYVPQSLAVYHLDTPDSSTKINDSADFMIALIERHRELSQQFNRADAFRPCIGLMLQVWIRQRVAQNRTDDARVLLERFCEDLSPRFRREIALRLRMPRPVQGVMDMYMAFKRKMLGRL